MQFLSHLLLESLTTICSCNHHRRLNCNRRQTHPTGFISSPTFGNRPTFSVFRAFMYYSIFCLSIFVVRMSMSSQLCKLLQAKTYSSSRDNSIESNPRSLAKTSPRLIAKGLVKGRASASRSRGRGEDIQPSKPVLRTEY